MKDQNRRAQENFLLWLRDYSPVTYAIAMRVDELKSGSDGNVGSVWGSIGSAFSSAGAAIANLIPKVASAAPSIISAKQQVEMMKINLERAKQGQDPIKVESVVPPMAVQVDTGPEATAAIDRAAQQIVASSQQTINENMKPLIYGALGLGALFVLMKK